MPAALQKMYGPLPLWGWIVVIAGSLGIAWYTMNRGGSNQPEGEPVTDTSGVPGVGNAGGPGWIQDEPPPPDDGSDRPTTNEEWGREVTAWLIAQGYPSGMSDQAIRKYLAAEQLSPQEQALVNAALSSPFGPPPVPLPPVYVPEEPEPETPPTAERPPQPRNFRVIGNGPHHVRVTWEEVPGAELYIVYAAEEGSGNDERGYSRATNPHPPENVTGLKPGTRYRLYVRAVRGGVQSNPSNSASNVTKRA